MGDNLPAPLPRKGAFERASAFARRLWLTLDMIKFGHTIFGLPFAMLGMGLAAGGWPPGRTLFWIVAACVFARSAAMAFNRLHDEPFDRQNPRTQGWALPAGLLTRKFVGLFCAVSIGGFVVASAMLNSLALALSPVALAILLGYSLMKRVTPGAHFFLGLALGIAPVGAWVGVRGSLSYIPILLGIGVSLWTAGFDIIYSCQDAEVDRRLGLYSIPSRFGKRRALAISALCHVGAVAVFLVLTALTPLGGFYLAALSVCAWLLVYEQSIVTPDDLTRLGRAFFTINGWISVLIFCGGMADILLGR